MSKGQLDINLDLNVISDTVKMPFAKDKEDNQEKKDETNITSDQNEIQKSVENMIDAIADNINNINVNDSSEGSSIENHEDEGKIDNNPQKKVDLLAQTEQKNDIPVALEEIVSKIQVLDGYTDDNANDEISKETFGMTEASVAKPMLSSGRENDESENDNNDSTSRTENKSKQKKKQDQDNNDDDDDIVQYTDEQLDEAFELFKKDKSLPPFLMRDAIIDYARRQSLQFMVDENYDAAYKNDLAVNDLLLEFSRDCGGYTTESITRNLELRIEMAKEQRQASNEKYQKRISQVKEDEQRKLRQLKEIQACERKQFELDCQSPEFLQPFSKPSKKLLQVRKIQKALALAHKFEEAKVIKNEGDILQRSETIQAKKRAIRYIKSSYRKLLEKQQHQIDCAAENRERKIRALLGQLERENAANQNLTRQLEQRLKESKTKKPSSLPPLTSNGTKRAPSKSTLRQLADYKSTQKISFLNVKLTNIQRIVGNVKPSPKPIKIV